MGPEPICERRRAGCAKRAFAGPNRPRETRGAVRCPAEPIVERERQSRRPPPPDPDPRLAACGPGTQRPEAYCVMCSKGIGGGYFGFFAALGSGGGAGIFEASGVAARRFGVTSA